MQNKLYPFVVAVLASFILSACSFPGVYKINVQQGNIVTSEMLEQLQPGMTRRQVHFVLGTPIVSNVFSNKYENYIYHYIPAKGDPQQQSITVYYEGDIYTHHEGTPIEEHKAY